MEHYIRKEALECMARSALKRYRESYLNEEPQAVPIEAIIENVFGLSIEYKRLTEKREILGKMICSDGYMPYYDDDKDDYALMRVTAGTMLIEAALAEPDANYGRLRFTYAHELAHWMLHRKLLETSNEAAAMLSDDFFDDEDVFERQANYLAQALLMPNGQIKRCYNRLRAGMTHEQIVSEMARIFEVSKQAMGIRLNGIGLC